MVYWKRKNIFLVFSAVYFVFIVLHIFFYTQEDKLSEGIVTVIAPFIVCAGMKLIFQWIRAKAYEDFVIGLIAFHGFGFAFGFFLLLYEYVQNFPNGLAIGVNQCMAAFAELIWEMKTINLDETKQ